jgi:ribonuclease R
MIDAQGEILSYEVTQGVMRSISRMTYTQVHDVIRGDSNTREQFAPLVPEFERMYELARLLHKKRQRRGSIDFDLPEPVIQFDAGGSMQSIVRSERSWANRLIEEFMLSANECVASWLQNLDVPSLYRIHEKPEPRRVVEFEDLAAGFGYSLGIGSLPVKRVTMKSERREQRGRGAGRGHQPREHEIPEDIAVTPRMYQQLAIKIAGKPEERILAHMMLRSLRQARYSEKNEGHFALAAPCYTHFTSPIRRYPDLIVHRIARAVLASGESGIGVLATDSRPNKEEAPSEGPLSAAELTDIAYESSQAERRAEDAERELMEWKKVKFMQQRLGDDFDAMVMSVTRYGCFVELDNLFVEGLVPIMSLQGDHYTFRENTRQIMGEQSGRRYSMGDRVRVVLDRVDIMQRRLQFSILEEVAPLHLGRPAKGKAKAQIKTRSNSSGKAHPYIPPKNKVLRKGKQKTKNKRPGKKRG